MQLLQALLIPGPHVDNESEPMLPPPHAHGGAMQLWLQLPPILKQNGFGFFMKQYDDDMLMTDYERNWSYAANYYYFNKNKNNCSFHDWQSKVKTKVGGYKPDVTVEMANTIIEKVAMEEISFATGSQSLFTAQQLIYYGW